VFCCILLYSDDKVNAVVDLSLCIPCCLGQCLVRLSASAAGQLIKRSCVDGIETWLDILLYFKHQIESVSFIGLLAFSFE